MPEVDFTAVILAGGQSLRMGRDKAWIEHDGQSLLARMVSLVGGLSPREILISGRAGTDYSALRCPAILDRDSGNGPMSGIERGLAQAMAPLVLVLAVDLPQMTEAFLRKLLARCVPLTGVVPRLANRLEPLAAVYPRRCHAFAARALIQRDLAAAHFAEACLRERAVRILRVNRRDAGCFVNVNTPQDIASLSAVKF